MVIVRHIEGGPEPEPANNRCPRCNGMLFTSGLYEPSCAVCGYADYTFSPDTRPIPMGKGAGRPPNWETALYLGDYHNWKRMVVRFLYGDKYLDSYTVVCPWCDVRMMREMGSSKGNAMYRCRKKHRIRMSEGHDGSVFWE